MYGLDPHPDVAFGFVNLSILKSGGPHHYRPVPCRYSPIIPRSLQSVLRCFWILPARSPRTPPATSSTPPPRILSPAEPPLSRTLSRTLSTEPDTARGNSPRLGSWAVVGGIGGEGNGQWMPGRGEGVAAGTVEHAALRWRGRRAGIRRPTAPESDPYQQDDVAEGSLGENQWQESR
jgi:hypothetical protein